MGDLISPVAIGLISDPPTIVVSYDCISPDGRRRKRRKRKMPLRDFTDRSNVKRYAFNLRQRHTKYLEKVIDVTLEKMLRMIQEIQKGQSVDVSVQLVNKEYTIDPDEDLNKLSPAQLAQRKAMMDEAFHKNLVRPSDPEFVYDKVIEFNSEQRDNDNSNESETNDWDDDSPHLANKERDVPLLMKEDEIEITSQVPSTTEKRFGDNNSVPGRELNLNITFDDEDELIPAEEDELIPAEEDDFIPAEEEEIIPAEEDKLIPAEEEEIILAEEDELIPAEEDQFIPAKEDQFIPAEEDELIPAEEEEIIPAEEEEIISAKKEEEIIPAKGKEIINQDDKNDNPILPLLKTSLQVMKLKPPLSPDSNKNQQKSDDVSSFSDIEEALVNIECGELDEEDEDFWQ